MKVPLVIITGYLGSGKTTLLRSLLSRSKGRRMAVLMNEFGEIGVDSAVVKGQNVDMVELAGGCVCCSLSGELEAGLKEVVERVKPEMVILETTGVAEPDAIVDLIDADFDGVRIDSVIAVVDADALVRSPSIGHTGRVQVEMADVILLNKVDLVDKENADAIEKRVSQINGRAQVYKTVRCDVDWGVLLGMYKPKAVRHKDDEHIEVSQFVLNVKEMDKKKFEELVSSLPSAVYRSKGFVTLGGTSYLFNFVNGRFELEEWNKKEKQAIVFIGKNVEKEKKHIEKKLMECE